MAKTIVVSGGGTGIGLAVARRFAHAGHAVTIIGRRKAVLDAAARELNDQTGRAAVQVVAADLSQPDDVDHAAATIAPGSSVDVIVNHAGGVGTAPGEGLASVAADWEGEFRRNVLTAVLLTSVLAPRLRRPGASIVNLSSIAALAGGGDAYSAAKAALIGWTLDLAVRLGPDGVRANAVVPAMSPTPSSSAIA
jgi:3-oxoacyl-[acyl-carrier protein] reductase